MRRLLVLTLAATAVLAAPAHAGSPFEWRGIVEGPYGPPWDHGQRSRVIEWMPAHGFNAYVHAPKDDLYQRTQWRDPYPAAEQREFDAEIRRARALGVDWIPNLSPAAPLIPTPAPPTGVPSAPLCFSCPGELDAVVAKLRPFIDAGSRTVMISFDDVTKVLTDPRDVAAYGGGDEGFGRANGDFLTRLAARLPGVRVLTVGADYSGTSDTPYLTGLRETLARQIDVMWTGVSIPSKAFTPADARGYGEAIGRPPVVWDNWTNNDTAGNFGGIGTARIFLGPYKRDPAVSPELRGFFFNPMNEADLNLLPLATAGDWMRDPRRYRERSSWLRAVRELAGPGRRGRARREPLRAFAEASYSTKLDFDDAPTFARRSRVFLERYTRGPGWVAAHTKLLRELRLAEQASVALPGMPNRAFADQADPFLSATRQAASTGRRGTGLLAAERPTVTVRRTRRGFAGRATPPDPDRADALRGPYRDGVTATKASRRFVYGWRGGTAFEIPPYAVPDNLMDTYFDRIDELDAAWQQRADRAARSVTLTLNGRTLRLGDGGTFRLSRKACGRLLIATDGAGEATAKRVPKCRR
jgi:hyaluronoglucosaminidase